MMSRNVAIIAKNQEQARSNLDRKSCPRCGAIRAIPQKIYKGDQLVAQYDFTKMFDVKTLLEIQRKNILAFSEAQRLAYEGLQAVAQRQSEILSQIAEENSSLAKDIMNEGTPEEKIARHADLMKKNYEKSVANWNELTGMISDSGKEASDIISHRVTASLTEMKATLGKNAANGKGSAHKKAA